MTAAFHDGELQVQRLLGAEEEAASLRGMITDKLPPVAMRFLPAFDFVLATSIDGQHQVWTSFLTGPKGFVTVASPTTIFLAIDEEKTFFSNVEENDNVGFLFINLQARVRLRINGKIQKAQTGFQLDIAQSYFNCPKYIQSRTPIRSPENSSRQASEISSLNREHLEIISKADTFFISTFAPDQGSDCSHRGGMPGFVQVVNDKKIRWPDYPGNNLYNSFGNLQVNPHCGLLFIDFANNRILQLTGTAKLVFDDDQHHVEFDVIAMNDILEATPFHWKFYDYSPFNPR
jgi:predicted pyridoxine 5'-phosphate oxidase superfamily flavin-nucleotide-binding protein